MRTHFYPAAFLAALLTGILNIIPIPVQARNGEAIPDDSVVVISEQRATYREQYGNSATRTDSPATETPQSIQVVNRQLITDQDAKTLGDVLVNVSGVRPIKAEEVLFTAPIVRGFPSEVYLDGLPLYGGSQTATDPTGLVGVERVEVVKGPSGTIYGGGLGAPLGGLINVESKRPEKEFQGMFGLRAGSFYTFQPFLDINTPLSDTVLTRLTAEFQQNASWIARVRGDRWSVKPSILISPSPGSELLIQSQWERRSQLEYSGIPAEQALAGKLDRTAFPGATIGQPRTTVDNKQATVEFNHIFDDQLKSSIALRHFQGDVSEFGSTVYPEGGAPNPATPFTYPIFPIYLGTRTKETTIDGNLLLRKNMLWTQHQVLLGVNVDKTSLRTGLDFNGTPIGVVDLSNPAGSLPFVAPAVFSTQTDDYLTMAVYAQDQATYGRFHFTNSLRASSLHFREKEQRTNQTYLRLLPRIGMSFDVTDAIAFYGGYAAGFRGAFTYTGNLPAKPETSKNYEAGLKFDQKHNGFSGSVALYHQSRENVSTSDPADPGQFLQTGEQRACGLEADVIWEPVKYFALIANYAYTNANVVKDTVIEIGSTLPRVPRNSGRIAARFRLHSGPGAGLSFGAGVSMASERELTLPNKLTVPGYALVDAQASYDRGPYSLGLSAANVMGRRIYDTYQYLGFPVVIPVQPRSASLTLTIHF
jgi:iron complex outermembrane receptor protein